MSGNGNIEDVVEAAVRAQVAQMITQSLEGVDGLTARIVAGAMQAKVKDGSTYREIPFIQKLAADAVRDAAREAMAAWIQDNRAEIQAEVERMLKAQRRSIAESLVTSLASAAGSAYRLSVVFQERES